MGCQRIKILAFPQGYTFKSPPYMHTQVPEHVLECEVKIRKMYNVQEDEGRND